MFKNTIIFLLGLALFSCKTQTTDKPKGEESPVKIAKYYVRYVEQIKELQLEAKFINKSDSTFGIAGGVNVKDFKLETKNLPKEGWIHRYVKRPSGYDSLYVFTYNPDGKNETKDSVIFPVYQNFKLETPKISKKTGGLVSWSGSSLGQEDGLTMVFEDASGANYTINHVGITRGPQLEIRPEFLEVFAKGKGILRVVHKKTVIDKKEDKRCVRLTEYYRIPIEMEIVD
jgi:hypothetical protein